MKPSLAALGFVLLLSSPAKAQRILVQPYLQQMTPTSVWILWETDNGENGVVDWGPTAELGQTTPGSSQANVAGSRIHEVELTGLSPQTTYYYRVRVGNVSSPPNHLHTPGLQAAEETTRIVVMSDMQRDGRQPQIYRQILNQGVAPYCREQVGAALPEALSMVLIPGDLVPNGLSISQWRNYFFADGAELMSQVPFYPVLGNHENNSPFYFNYFHLPENGTPGSAEQWWWFDQSNIRIIGLDSNGEFRTPQQLTWLSGVLDEACNDEAIDFVFAQLHHPHRSELWIAGNTGYTGEVIELLEQFSTHCGKPSVHFYGHTHGYSRGQSREHNHTMVNAASAGGALDRWGEYAQVDYEEFTKSSDDYGFVHVEVRAGDDPSFRIRRLSFGTPEAMTRNALTDELIIRRNNEIPEQPVALAHNGRVAPECFTLGASEFRDPEGDEHGASQWQVATACNDFSEPVVNIWRQYENHYFGEDRNANIDLTTQEVEGLRPNADYCWRVRFRDKSLGWSAWSEPAAIWTGERVGTDNLLTNGGAEQGIEGWEAVAGPIESLSDGECAGIAPFEGQRYFAIGGMCSGEVARGEARQSVDVRAHAERIDLGGFGAQLVAHLRDYNGSDQVSAGLVFFDEQGAELGRPTPLARRSANWLRMVQLNEIPVGTRQIDVVLVGERNAGTDNDSYADSISLRLRHAEQAPCQEAPEPPPPFDAGPSADVETVVDASLGVDAQAVAEAGIIADAGPPSQDVNRTVTDAATEPVVPAEGCGCSGGTLPSLFLGLPLLALRRRRSLQGKAAV
jgi:hypothetical protein